MTFDPDSVHEVTPGRFKALRDCSPLELEDAAALAKEMSEMHGELEALYGLAVAHRKVDPSLPFAPPEANVGDEPYYAVQHAVDTMYAHLYRYGVLDRPSAE